MDRRRFMTNSLATGLTAPVVLGPTSALATIDEDDPAARVEDFQRVFLQLPGVARAIVLTQLVIIAGEFILLFDMQRRWQRFAASRGDVSKVPLFGALSRQTVQNRIVDMNPVGQMFLITTTLLLVASALPKKARKSPASLTIVNEKNEFTTKTKGKRAKLDVKKTLAKARKVPGNLLFDNETGELLADIPPHLWKR